MMLVVHVIRQDKYSSIESIVTIGVLWPYQLSSL